MRAGNGEGARGTARKARVSVCENSLRPSGNVHRIKNLSHKDLDILQESNESFLKDDDKHFFVDCAHGAVYN